MKLESYSLLCALSIHFIAAKKASSPSEIVSELEGMEVPPASARTFAQEIFAKVERRTSGLSVSFPYNFTNFTVSHASQSIISIFWYLNFFVTLSYFNAHCYSCVFLSALSETREGGSNVGEKAEHLCNFGG